MSKRAPLTFKVDKPTAQVAEMRGNEFARITANAQRTNPTQAGTGGNSSPAMSRRSRQSNSSCYWLGRSEDNRGIVLVKESVLAVAFRGTRLQVHRLLDLAEVVVQNQSDLCDGRFLPTAWRGGGRVLRGFLGAFEEVSDRLDAIVEGLSPAQRLWLTGDSLGGAPATLAAADLEPSAIHGMVSNGSLRVGNPAFVTRLPEASIARYVHRLCS